MNIYHGMPPLEWHRNPLRLELVRHVIPLVIFLGLICVGLGYAWAMAALRSGL
jgi:NADH:ubiquinone oxidoreductase subunit 3 (subunit A)